jgi:versiconal hemiacetal acetate esterase
MPMLTVSADVYSAPFKDKYANPILHPRLSELPKTYIASCGQDTLRDDARLMRDALKQAGVSVKYDEFSGFPHYFWTFPAPSLEQPSNEYLRKVGNGVKYVLSSSSNM